MVQSGNGKIADNPSFREIRNLVPLARMVRFAASVMTKLGCGGERLDSIYEATVDFISQADLFDLPDRFNAAFAESGWISTSSLSVDVMRQALRHHEQGDDRSAEEEILSWFTKDVINLLAINRTKKFNKASLRWDQLQEAMELTFEERYMAAVPLILIACDGFASDVMGYSPFNEDADLTLFDSMVGHPTSLQALIRQVVGSVKRSSDEVLKVPLRHGILHGRSLGYANREVCFKAWMLMIALVDWAIDKSQDEARKSQQAAREAGPNWREISERRKKLVADKRLIDSFKTIEWTPPFGMTSNVDTPVVALTEFLTAWKGKNYGLMANRSVNITNRSDRKLAGLIRSSAELVDLIEFELLSVRQSTVARAESRVLLRGRSLNREIQGEFQILIFRDTFKGDIAMPTDEGHWVVQQGCVFDLLNGRTVDFKDNEN